MGAPSSKPAAPVAVPPKQLSEQTIQNLLEVQSKELSLRSKEMDLRLREMDNNSAHAEKILPAQERDREAVALMSGRLAFTTLYLPASRL